MKDPLANSDNQVDFPAGGPNSSLYQRTQRGGEAVGGDLEVGEGEIVGFLGTNGAGKTTTLRMLATLSGPTSRPGNPVTAPTCARNPPGLGGSGTSGKAAVPTPTRWSARNCCSRADCTG